MNAKRQYSFDILRVIAMIMVVIVHVSNIYSRSFGIISRSSYLISLLFNTISRISVPLFFMISGSLLLDRKFDKNKYIKRIIKFIILIIVWDIIYLVWEYLYLGIKYNNLLRLLIEPYRTHLWFLYSIVVIYLTQPILKIILDKSNIYIKLLFLFIWLTVSSLCMFNSVLASSFSLCNYIGYFIIGKYINDLSIKYDLKKYNIVFILLIIISLTLSIILNYKISISSNSFFNIFFAYRTPFIMTSSILFFILVNYNYKKDGINSFIKTLSSVSLGVYLIHGIFLDITSKLFIYSSINSLIGIPLFSIIILVLSIISVLIINKIKILNYIIS